MCPQQFFYDFNEKQKTKQNKAKQQQQKPSEIRERSKVTSGLKTHVLGAVKKTECTIK